MLPCRTDERATSCLGWRCIGQSAVARSLTAQLAKYRDNAQNAHGGILSQIAFHEKAGRSQVGSFVYSLTRFFCSSRVATAAILPSALSMSDFRSVQVGCSRFSRCCYLIGDLSSISKMKVGQAINAVTGTRRFGFCLSLSKNVFKLLLRSPLGCCCARGRTPLRSPTSDAATRRAFWPWQ